MHPLISSLQDLSDSQLEEKIVDLQGKYFSSGNTDVQNQIVMLLDAYKEEAQTRRRLQYQKSILNSQENGETGLDSLINVS
jgi:hypothetical protein